MPSTKPAPTESPSELITRRIRDLDDWRGKRLAKIRALIHEADPAVVEEWKWMGTPVWSHDGIVCTGESYKEVVKLTFAKGASLAYPAKLFNASLDATSVAPSTFARATSSTNARSARSSGRRSSTTRRTLPSGSESRSSALARSLASPGLEEDDACGGRVHEPHAEEREQRGALIGDERRHRRAQGEAERYQRDAKRQRHRARGDEVADPRVHVNRGACEDHGGKGEADIHGRSSTTRPWRPFRRAFAVAPEVRIDQLWSRRRAQGIGARTRSL